VNRQEIEKKVGYVIRELLNQKGYVTFVDLFMKFGLLDKKGYEDWRFKRVPCLEAVIKTNLARISFIMNTARRCARNGGLRESWTDYRSWGKGRKIRLRFCKSGAPSIEKTYATHFLKPNAEVDSKQIL